MTGGRIAACSKWRVAFHGLFGPHNLQIATQHMQPSHEPLCSPADNLRCRSPNERIFTESLPCGACFFFRRFCLSPTNEEEFTKLVSLRTSSWRQLPRRVYQITRKFRDENRPRYGLLRGREFVMHDMYTFDADEEGSVCAFGVELDVCAEDRAHECGCCFMRICLEARGRLPCSRLSRKAPWGRTAM